MKMYKVTESDTQQGAPLHWFSSETKAKQFAKMLKDATTVEAVEFPSGKKAILDWLNANCTKNNG